MLAISAAVIYKCTLISNSAKFMFPPANCDKTFVDYQASTAAHNNNKQNADDQRTLEQMWSSRAL